MMVVCDGCGKALDPTRALMFERSLDDTTVEDSALVVKGWCCPDIDCLCEATGIMDEGKRERDEDGE